MEKIKLAVPTNNPGGMGATRSGHFGQADVFTIIDFENGQVSEVSTVGNVEHGSGGCMVPVKHLKEHDVDVLVVGGMGMRPLQGFNEVGIKVFYADREEFQNVQAVVDGFLQNKLPEMQAQHACGGGSDCHH
ncbi:MAG: NifB/NifX family molybdenum-iron cluster-binding protein [Deltaproteobacteria bacterium]|jgi:predicted Fe-Mo cluster-binding NifX family protein|nr:NifB/NifX family molybdenum-iron cluster-binding protein [Deltaproteobacteria bacterium]